MALNRHMVRPTLLSVLVAAALLHIVLFLPVALPLPLLGLAAVILTGLLPGYLLVEWLVGGLEDAPLDSWEQSLYTVGAGVAVIVVTMLLLSYLPGPIQWWQTLLAFDGLLAVLGVGLFLRNRRQPTAGAEAAAAPANWSPVGQGAPRKWLIAGLLSVAVIAGFMRLTNLNYSEFQGDETRALLRTAEAIQGLESTLMLHKKGPGEILLPGSIYSLVDRINEATARLPFSLLNLAGIFAVYLLGLRLFGPLAGWSAALILALDGYFIGFARIVQYQSIVFCLVTLTILVLYRLTQQPRRLSRFLTLAALFLATGLLAHYEAALAVLPALYLLYRIRQTGVPWGQLTRAMLPPVLLGAVILALFYVPFVRDPTFGATFNYITVNRIGVEAFPYNKLTDFFERSALYSTSYYLFLMIALTTGGLLRIYWRGLPRLWALAAGAVIIAGVAMSFIRPSWLIIGGQDHTWAFFTLALLGAWFIPRFPMQERVAWLWFGAPMIFMLFFTLTPNTHVYGFIIAWSLVVGHVIQVGYTALCTRLGRPPVRNAGLATAAVLIAVFGNYATWYFVATEMEVLRTWRVNRPPGYWVPYDMPTNMSIFGFPLKNGWKVVGQLYDEGTLDAPFKLHGKEPVADWYTRGMGQCPRDHVYYLWHESVEPMEQGFNNVVRQQIEDQGYQLYGQATVNGEPRLAIYTLGDAPQEARLFPVEKMETHYDRALSDPFFEMDGPVGAPDIRNPLDFRFGESIRLLGYNLAGQENEPGGAVQVTLYWRAEQPVQSGYSVFTQIIDRTDNYKAGQRDGEPGCNLFPTDTWRSGEVIVDRYYIPLREDARPGTYAVLIGMYDSDSGERLEIHTPAGDLMGDSLGIDEVRMNGALSNGTQGNEAQGRTRQHGAPQGDAAQVEFEQVEQP